MNYKKLKTQLKTQKEMREYYQELYYTRVNELHFEHLQTSSLVNLLNEVESLCDEQINHKLIKKVVENGKERRHIDMMIHADIILK